MNIQFFSFKFPLFVLSTVLILGFASCEEDSALFISPNQQIELGRQLDSTIMASPGEYPILDEDDYPEAYDYLEGIFDEILSSDAVRYKDFPWQIRIIEDDETLNAFAAPGGFVYVYTGLIKYLEQEDDLVGVLGHEIAHADLEHSARALERQQGVSILLSVVLGQETARLGQIAAGLAGLQFSRSFETDADEKSVEYLADSPYNCAAARSFFQKLIDEEQAGGTPEFLSTHPNPDNRVENITEKAQEINCDTDPLNPPSYEDFKAMLP